MVIPETRLPWIFWGDGSQGQLIGKKDVGPDEDGIKMIEIRFRPTEELLALYGIPKSELDHEFSMSARYPKSVAIFLSQDPINQTLFVMCDVKGRETTVTNLNSYYLDTITGYEKRIKALTAQNAWLHSEMKKMTSHINEYIKQNAEMFLTAIKVRGDIDNPLGMGGGSGTQDEEGGM